MLVVPPEPEEQFKHFQRGLFLVWHEFNVEPVTVSAAPRLQGTVNGSADIPDFPSLLLSTGFGDLELFQVLPPLAAFKQQRTLYRVPAYGVELLLDALAVVSDVAVQLVNLSLALNDAGVREVLTLGCEAIIAVVKLAALEHNTELTEHLRDVVVDLFSGVDKHRDLLHEILFLVNATQPRTPRSPRGSFAAL